jgi:hypothetical protein
VLQIVAFSVSPFVLGLLYVATQIRIKRAPLRFRDNSSGILPRRWNCDYGRIGDVALCILFDGFDWLITQVRKCPDLDLADVAFVADDRLADTRRAVNPEPVR